MRVKEIMTKDVNLIKMDNSAKDAANIMRNFDVGALPVTKDNHVHGIVTDRDIVTRVIAEGIDPNQTKISQFMTDSNIHQCSTEDSIEEAARIMGDKQVRRLIVKNQNNQISGIISMGDIAANSQSKLTGDLAEKIAQPDLA